MKDMEDEYEQLKVDKEAQLKQMMEGSPQKETKLLSGTAIDTNIDRILEETKEDGSPPDGKLYFPENLSFAERISNQIGSFKIGKEKHVTINEEIDQKSTADVSVKPIAEEEAKKSDDGTTSTNKKKKKRKGSSAVSTGSGPTQNLRSRIRAMQKESEKLKKPRVGVVYDEEMLLHRHYREEHPERPERAMAIYINLVKQK